MNDQELKKLLKEIGHSITESVKATANDSPPPAAAPDPKESRLSATIKIVGLVASVLGILAVLYGVLHYVVSSSITDAFKQPSSDIAVLKEQATDLRRDVDRLLTKSAENIFKNPAVSAQEVKEAANVLQRGRVEIPLAEVVSAGEALLKHNDVSRNQDQWQAFLAVASYRSFLNGPGVYPTMGDWTETTYKVPSLPNKHPEVAASEAGLPIEQAARLEEIGKGHANDKVRMGPSLLVLTGGAIILDNYFFRHVELRNVEVHLGNNRLILEDVSFINCTFVFDDSGTGRELGKKILSSVQVNFRSPAA